MDKITVQVEAIKCERCGYLYIPRVANPWKCPKCQHTYGTSVKKPCEQYGKKVKEVSKSCQTLSH